jgi:hypothetical protein
MRGDMIEAFKILTRLYDGRVTEGMLDQQITHNKRKCTETSKTSK